jgi:hypothetical protein
MYLLVIVTLVIGMLSVYAQVLSLQAARLAAAQTGLARTMVDWHYAAVSMGAKIVDTQGLFPVGAAACSLTYGPPTALPNGVALCPVPAGAAGQGTTSGTVTDAANNPNFITASEQVHLPPGYNKGRYQFYSVLYRDTNSNQPYVVTFVNKPQISAANPAPGLISLPTVTGGSAQTSYTVGDLVHQLNVAGLPRYLYGTVDTAIINGTPVTALVTPVFQYTMPLVGGSYVPANGAVGIVTSVAGL